MDSTTGIATSVTHSTLNMGEYGEGQMHVATFNVGGKQQVRIEAKGPIRIGEGDLVVVAGAQRGGVLKGLAYENLSTPAKGSVGKLASFVGGIALFAVAGWCTNGTLAALAAIAGGWLVIRAVRISLAEIDVKFEVSRLR